MKEHVDALEILDRLRDELGSGRGFFAKKPDIGYCVELCDRLSDALPRSISDADFITQKRKDILANADVVAKNTIRAAEEKAKALVADSEIVRSAHVASKQIIENAYASCDNLILRTKAHLDKLFAETESFLCSTLATVRTNREELRGALRADNKAG